MGVIHTPDFFVLRATEARGEEWKTEEDLAHLIEHNPNRYCADGPGTWRCSPGDSAQFIWKDYYRRALIALEEPLIDHKISYRVRGVFRDNSGRLTLDSRAAGLEIRYALKNALIHRRPAAFFVDEACSDANGGPQSA